MFLILFFISVVLASDNWDYQLYTNSLGNEYNRVHLPISENQTLFKVNSNCAFGSLLTKGDSWNEFDIQYLPRLDVSVEKYLGKGDVHPFVALQGSGERNIGVMPPQPLIQAKNAIAGVSIGPSDKFRASVAINVGTGFHSKENATGILASGGISKDKIGFATSFLMEDISKSESASKLSASAYYGRNHTRYIIEYDRQFDKVFNPAEISIGIRQKRELNSREIFLFSSFAYGTSSSAVGSAPRLNVGITFNLQKKKKTNQEESEQEQVQELDDKEELYILAGVTPNESKEDEEDALSTFDSPTDPEPKSKPLSESSNSSPIEIPKNPKAATQNNVLDNVEPKNSTMNQITSKEITVEEVEMPDNNTTNDELNAHEVQPVVTPESLNIVTQQAGGDSSLSMLLAILAVVGGGAAWKFYTQYSEQKHEQKMKEMELQAKAAGLAGASPPPCQTAQAEMKAEIDSLKTKVNSTATLLEDVDLDLYARKIKKLDKRLKALEEPDDDDL